MSPEAYMTRVIRRNRNMMVPYYIMCCYAYYEEDNPLVSDGFFDLLARTLAREFTTVQHQHKNYLSEDAVSAATYSGPYPLIVKDSVESLRNLTKDKK